ncbi:hypothetical protein D3C87_1658730 [compost metagenome]
MRLVSGVPALARDGTKTSAERRQVVGRDSPIAQKSGGHEPAEPGAALQNLDHIPGIQQDRGAQDWGQLLRLAKDLPPFLQPFLLVPVGIVDHRMGLFPMCHRRKGGAGGDRVQGRGASRQKCVQLGKGPVQRCFAFCISLFVAGMIHRFRGKCRRVGGNSHSSAQTGKAWCSEGPAWRV